jgi:membrane-associated protein
MSGASGILGLDVLLGVFILGAVLGDTVNYWIGNYCGIHVFKKRFCNIFRDEHFQRTREYFDRYGGSTIFIARFIPIIRTFAPFLAGVGTMHYRRFLIYNVAGGIVWSCILVLAGYYFGTLPLVKENLNLLIYGVIFVTIASVIFILYSIVTQLRKTKMDSERSISRQNEDK